MMVFFNTGHLNQVLYWRVMFLLLCGLNKTQEDTGSDVEKAFEEKYFEDETPLPSA